jgi:hypothetical protein
MEKKMPLNLQNKPLEPFNVMAYDPGGTTGWAFISLPKYVIDEKGSENVELKDLYLTTGEFGPDLHHQEIYEGLTQLGRVEYPPLEVVFEPFTYRQFITEDDQGHTRASRHKVELISAEYIGVIKLACSQLGLSYYDRFTPGEAKSYVTDEKLRLLGWLQTPITPMRHRNDALRQLVKYLLVKKGVKHPLTTQWRRPT